MPATITCFQESRMSGNLLVRFDEGRVGRTAGVALSPTLLSIRGVFFHSSRAAQSPETVKHLTG